MNPTKETAETPAKPQAVLTQLSAISKSTELIEFLIDPDSKLGLSTPNQTLKATNEFITVLGVQNV